VPQRRLKDAVMAFHAARIKCNSRRVVDDRGPVLARVHHGAGVLEPLASLVRLGCEFNVIRLVAFFSREEGQGVCLPVRSEVWVSQRSRNLHGTRPSR